MYKRTDEMYALKMKASRAFFSEVCNKYTTMPFTLRSFEDEKKARLGVGECTNHELLMPYPVREEKEGEYVARFELTVLLMPNGPLRITCGVWDGDVIESEFSVQDEEIKTILATQVGKKTQKKKKKKTAAAAAAPAAVATDPAIAPTEPATVETVEQGVENLTVSQEETS